MIKKTLGVVFLILAFLLTISFLKELPFLIAINVKVFANDPTPQQIGAMLGMWFTKVILIIVISLLTIFGIKWVRAKKESQ